MRAIARVFTGTPKNTARLAALYAVKPETIVKAARRAGNRKAALRFVRWKPAEIEILRARYPNERTEQLAKDLGRDVECVIGQASRLGVKKTKQFLSAKMKGGNAGGFRKGQIPQNKGKKMPPGWAPGRMRETQFKKGERSGKAAEHYAPVGTERDIEGVLYVKVADVPNVAYTVNWIAVHDLVWMRANGPIPKKHFVEFIDRNKRNFDLANLRLCSFAENLSRNRLHQWPKDLQVAIVLKNKILRNVKERRALG